MDWIFSSNKEKYDVVGAFASNELVDWNLTNARHVSVGDTVYIYSARPDSRILFKCQVAIADVPKNEFLDDSTFWRGGAVFGDNGRPKARLQMIASSDSEELTLKHLRSHGLKRPQAQQRISHELSQYLNEIFARQRKIIDYTEVDPSGTYSEGHCRIVAVNKYERNPNARRKCIERYGSRCAICGIDFGERYGEYARGFIHVHHLRPLHTIGEGYEVDPEKDLIPVCPNCHAMIHRLPGGEEMGVEELKARLLQSS